MKKALIIFAMFAVMTFVFANASIAGTNAEANSENDIEIDLSDNSHNETKEARQFGNGAHGAYGFNAPAHMAAPSKTHNIQGMEEVLMYRVDFTYGMLKELAKGSKATVDYKPFNSIKPEDAPKDCDRITFVLIYKDKETGKWNRPAKRFIDAGHVTVNGKSKTKTIEALALAGMRAIENGCDKLAITGAGAKKIMEAGGWGIMIGNTVLNVTEKSNSATGVVAAGGIGYAEAWAAYGFCPWLQAWGIKTIEDDAPETPRNECKK